MVLNNRPYPDWHEGLTIRGVMEHMKFTWPKLVVKVNGQLVWPEDYDKVTLEEADDLKIYHLLGCRRCHLDRAGLFVPVLRIYPLLPAADAAGRRI